MIAPRVWASLVVAALLSTLPALPPRASASSAGTSFTSFQLGTASVGESCPNSTTPCTNFAAEPQIRADNAGNFYGSSENGLGGGTDAWKSTDGGLHYTYRGMPNAGASSNNTGFAPGGGDTYLATA